nr:glycoside hydrolase family 5 subfamily 2 [Tetropium fuscum]
MNMSVLLSCLVVLGYSVGIAVSSDAALETVSVHGQLSVDGVNLVDQNGTQVQLKGMSLFWSIWATQYYNETTVAHIYDDCHSNAVRAAMAITTEDGGYLTDPDGQLALVETVIEAAIANDIYVIVDWHEETAQDHVTEAKEFFDTISKKYGDYPNIIYETFNEPLDVSWSTVLKPYHEEIIETIRANDADNVIILGTPYYSQKVDQAAADPITNATNIMYTLHFYAGTHKETLRNTAQAAIDDGLPIFVTEYGTVNADGDGDVDVDSTDAWWTWLDTNKMSYLNWAISDKDEGSNALLVNTTAANVCLEDYLSTSGLLVVAQNES